MKNSLALQAAIRTQIAVADVRQRAADRMAEDRGAAMAEYGLLLGLIAVVSIIILTTFGKEIEEVFTDANTQLDNR